MARRNRRSFKGKNNKIIQRKLIRNITILLILIVFMFVMYRFNFSSKSVVIETAKVTFKEFGTETFLEDQDIDIEVQSDADGRKYISWPQTINGYYVLNYYVLDSQAQAEIAETQESEINKAVLEKTIKSDIQQKNEIESSSQIKNETEINQQQEKNQVSTENVVKENDNKNQTTNTLLNETTNETSIEQTAGIKTKFLTSQEYNSNNSTNTENKVNETNTLVKNETTPNTNIVTNNTVGNIVSTNTVTNTTLENNTSKENTIQDNKQESPENTQNADADIGTIAEENKEIDYSKYIVRPGMTYYVEETSDKNKFSIGDTIVLVEYDTINTETQKLYKQNLTWIDESTNTGSIGYLDDLTKIEVITYAPLNSELVCSRGNFEELESEMQTYEDLQDFDMLCAYDIKIKNGEEFYQPKDYSSTADVTITSIDLKNLQGVANPKLIHFAESGIRNFESFETDLNSISFTTDSFSVFAVLSEKTIVDNKINIDNYTDDYNYYIGKNYTDNNAGTNQNLYNVDNLAKVVVNYHGSRETEYNETGTETIETPIFTGETEEFSSTNLEYTTFQNVGNGSSTRYAYFSTTITLNDDSIIDRTKSWQITLTMNFYDNYSVESENPNRFNGYRVNGTNITISDDNWDDWNGNELELRILVKNSRNQRPNANNIRISNGMRLTATRQVVTGYDTSTYTYVTSLLKSDTGYISADSNERQNVVSYTKCVPIENGKVTFDLIDNPFMDRPVGKKQYFDENKKLIEDKTTEVPFGFNGWSSSQYSPEISMNNSTKVQTLSTAITGKEIVIDLYVDWEPANVVFVNPDTYGDGSSLANPAGSWEDAISKLNQNIKRATNASDRELNIIVITGTYALPDYYNALSSANAGYTVTSLYNGIDYRNNGAAIQISQSITLYNDLQLDFLNIEGPESYQSAASSLNGNYINGNSKNLRIGRGMMPQNATNQRTTFSQVQSGGGSGQFRTVVESGKYSNIYTDRGSSGSNHNTNSVLVLGSDYDRVLEKNDTLQVYARVSARIVSGVVTKTDSSKPLYDLTVKSGTIGIDSFTTYNNEDSTYAGIYVGGWSVTAGNNTYDDGDRVLTVEGGNIANIVGGLTIASNHTQNTKTRVYIKGSKASVQNIVGGAGRSTTYGDRTIQVTGGTVQYSVCGGSNGVYSTNSDNGVLTGNTLIYVGGTANIGGDNRLTRTYRREDGNNLYGVQYGTVLGAGNGSASIADAGIVTKSHVIVDGNARIKNGVFGGGNYGSVRFDNSPYQGSTQPVVEYTNESNRFTTNENYLITSGTNSGISMSVSGNNLQNKDFSTNIYPSENDEWVLESAGNNRYYIKNVSTGRYLNYEENYYWGYDPILSTNRYAFNVTRSNNGIQIYASISNGWNTRNYYYNVASNEFTTYTTTVYFLKYTELPLPEEEIETDITEDSAVTIDIFGGTVENNVYGGSNQNNISGNVKINMDNGTVGGTIYGGSNTRGTVSKSTRINIFGGNIGNGNSAIVSGGYGQDTTITGRTILNIIDNKNNININGDVYGGSEQGAVNATALVNVKDIDTNTTKINITGNIYGAGKGTTGRAATNQNDINVIVDGGVYGNVKVFGGANINGTIRGKIKVQIGKNISTYVNEVYGGGNQAPVNSGNNTSYSDYVYLYQNARVDNAFNGGNEAGINNNFERAIYAQGATVTNLYGGSNVQGDLNVTNVYCTDGATIENVYGGGLGENAKVTGNTNISITDSTITNAVFGGGNAGSINNTTNINAKNSQIKNVFGGGLGTTATVGTNQGKTIIKLEDTTVTENVYGGGDKGIVNTDAEGTSTDITILRTTAKNVFGGGRGIEATVNGNVKLYIQDNSNVLENVYGGGDLAETKGNIDVSILNSTITQNLYGGGNGADSQPADSTNVPGKVGGNTNISVTEANPNECIIHGNVFGAGRGITATVEGNTITNINQNVAVEGNVYGGGDNGKVTGQTTVNINSATIGTSPENDGGYIFGAGKGTEATVSGNTNVSIQNVSGDNKIVKDVYGGGELGAVEGSTNVRITSSNINGSAYGAGKGQLGEYNKSTDTFEFNGLYALVKGSSNIIVEGNTTIENNLFGGGDAANIGATGTSNADTAYMPDSNAFVYVSGGIIKGNIYGGANRSKVWGNTEIYIGKKAIDAGYEQGKIEISGTVFGGGESVNPEGTFTYDFKSVNGDITIDIDGESYDVGSNSININGSIFGSGNASSAAKNGNITIKNYGTSDNAKRGVSIQRATTVAIDNSAMRLSGTTDSTNEYADTNYTLNNISALELRNNSTLFLRYGSNLLESFYSYVNSTGDETAKVTITDDYQVTSKNVDNRLYMYSGQNLNIAASEDVLSKYGIVKGMTFFGIYQEDSSGNIYAGMYDKDYNIANPPTWDQRNFNRSYVLGLHQTNHDIKIDGFYTVYDELSEEKLQLEKMNRLDESNYESISAYINYITPTPPSDDYYMWYAGPNRPTYNYSFVLQASKYSTLGAKELNLVGLSFPNAVLSLDSFSISNWKDGVGLYDKNTIKNVDTDQNRANNNLALTMKTGNTGWSDTASTDFFISPEKTYDATNDFVLDDNYHGSSNYIFENATITPTLSFYLYHSNNIQITDSEDLGNYTIVMNLSYMEGQNRGVGEVIIDISLKVLDASDNGYNASITPGMQYDLFTATLTDVTNKSSFSTFFELAQADFKNAEGHEDIKKLYNKSYRVINTEYPLPVNSTITMIDRSENGAPRYYYYNVEKRTNDDGTPITEYRLSDFLAMGSKNEAFDEQAMNEKYYHDGDGISDYQYESFIFIVNLENAEYTDEEKARAKITQDDPKMRIELRAYDSDSDKVLTLSSLIDYQLTNGSTRYDIYNGESVIGVNASIKNPKLYVGFTDDLTVNTTYTATEVDLGSTKVKVYDTKYFDKKLGLKLTLKRLEKDASGNVISSETVEGTDLLGTYFEVNGNRYYPRTDGTTRIKISELVSNVSSKITINAEKSTLPSGDYIIQIETYGSADGLYFGSITSAQTQVNVTVVNDKYGLKSSILDERQVVIDRSTGYTLDEKGYISDGDNNLNITLEYASSLEKPYVTVSLERRKYDDIYSREYESKGIDIANYLQKVSDVGIVEPITGAITTINKDVEDMTADEKIRKDRVEYEAVNTETLKSKSNKADEVGIFNLDYKILSPETALKSGTYRIVYTLYDINNGEYQYIGEVFSYIIIK